MNRKHVLSSVFILIVILLASSGQIINLYIDWLWFKQVRLETIFLKILSAKATLAGILGLLFFGLMYVNFYLSRKMTSKTNPMPEKDLLQEFSQKIHDMFSQYSKFVVLGIAVLGIFCAIEATNNSDMFLRYFNFSSFGDTDPVFKKDIGFYVFKLPVLNYLYNWLMFSLVLTTALVVLVYIFNGGVFIMPRNITFSKPAKLHISFLVCLILLVKAYGYRLTAYGLLYSSKGTVFGATYTDIHTRLPVLNILFVICLICALLFLINIFIDGWKLPIVGIGLLIVVSFLGLTVYPNLIQKLQVTPNEIVVETPYIQRNIEYTKKAYGLDNIEERKFSASGTLSLAKLKNNASTINNIRLWDHRPLLSTYRQLQEIRTYYKFVDVDIDRYIINGEYRQVLLSARELDYEKLPSRIWINEHLSFTHGYGVCLSPVNIFTPEGMPELMIKDIPPVGLPDLTIERPGIYYGEIANDYVIVKTKSKEFDYPSGEKNVYCQYDGRGGVEISSIWRKLMFAWKFHNLKILLNTDITKESKMMYYRKINERLKKAFPFIKFDDDPYIVISKGKIYWICDGYTTTGLYPYSQPVNEKLNYMRNSIKAVVDAYDGDMTLYISDETDPLIQTYNKIFPGIFMSLDKMPADLRTHIRYPEELFKVQMAIYSVYHMENPQIFYNKEDVWHIPTEIFERNEQTMEPYYVIMKLPGKKKEEFILMIPFTPINKSNLSAWFCARCDGDNYGKLMVFKFPKKKLIYGPMQIEARIDQDAEISQQLSLWGQRGSDVIRGNLLVIPIEDSLLYVEPLYLKAEKGQLPELKRVIVSYKNRIVMEDNLDSALARVLIGTPSSIGSKKIVKKGMSTAELVKEALKHFKKLRSSYRHDDWTGFGQELKRVEQLLLELNKK